MTRNARKRQDNPYPVDRMSFVILLGSKNGAGGIGYEGGELGKGDLNKENLNVVAAQSSGTPNGVRYLY